MALLPEGFALPPLAHLAVLVVAVLVVAALLYATSPPVTERTVLALGPWMVLGSALYALYQIDAVPPLLAPFFGSPTVYATTFVLLGALWAASSRLLGSDDAPPARIATDGPAAGEGSRTTAIVLGVVGSALALGVDRLLAFTLDPGHLVGMGVVIRQGVVDVGQVEVVAVGNRFRINPVLLNELPDEANGDPSPFEVWLVVDVGFLARDDVVARLRHHAQVRRHVT